MVYGSASLPVLIYVISLSFPFHLFEFHDLSFIHNSLTRLSSFVIYFLFHGLC